QIGRESGATTEGRAISTPGAGPAGEDTCRTEAQKAHPDGSFRRARIRRRYRDPGRATESLLPYCQCPGGIHPGTSPGESPSHCHQGRYPSAAVVVQTGSTLRSIEPGTHCGLLLRCDQEASATGNPLCAATKSAKVRSRTNVRISANFFIREACHA